VGFLDPRGGGKKKKNTKQGNGSSCSLMADVESFPPLHDHMVSSSGGVFVGDDRTRKVTVGLDVANLQKLDVNVPDDTDYNVWLPLAMVYEVNDRMKNSFYGYFIGKRLVFPVVEWFVRNN
ncbi:hypothetical protein Tco_1398706, partial [Tanacetum coccineum]